MKIPCKKVSEHMQRAYQALTARGLIAGEFPQKEFAALLNTSPQNVNNWERRGMSQESMLKVQEVMGINVNWVRLGYQPMFIDRGRGSDTDSVTHARTMKNLAERLAEARRDVQLTQGALAKLAKCGQSTIASIERGRNQGSTVLPRLSEILGVSALWLAEGRGPKHAERSHLNVGDKAPQSPTLTIDGNYPKPEISRQKAGEFAGMAVSHMLHDAPIVSMESIMQGKPAPAPGGERVRIAQDTPGDFVVEAEDDSMIHADPPIRRGALMLIHVDGEVVTGQPYLVAFAAGRPIPRIIEAEGPHRYMRTSPTAPQVLLPDDARIVGEITSVIYRTRRARGG